MSATVSGPSRRVRSDALRGPDEAAVPAAEPEGHCRRREPRRARAEATHQAVSQPARV